MTTDRRTTGKRHFLKPGHPVATVFMDETGSVSADRYFAIGCLKLPDPSVVLREIQRLRDRHNRHNEVKFTKVTKQKLDFYRRFVDCVLADPSAKFFCFIADRAGDDPVTRFGTQWDAYAKLAEQLVHGVTAPDELLTILADNYSTPQDVLFEPTLRRSVNRRMHRLTVTSVVRLDSRTSDGLQLVDLLTSAIAFEFRAANGLAGSYLKTELSNHLRDVLGADSCLDGFRSSRHSIAIYNHGSWRP